MSVEVSGLPIDLYSQTVNVNPLIGLEVEVDRLIVFAAVSLDESSLRSSFIRI